MSRTRWVKAGTVTAVLALAAAACGGGGGNEGQDSTKNGEGGAEAAYNAGLDSVVNKSDKKGGTLNFAATGDFDSLDPGRTYYAYSWNFQRLIQRTPMMFAAAVEGSELKPDLVTDKGEFSDDGKTVKYTLRDGLKFEDGTPITSKDVKYGISRLFATDVINGGPSTYYISLLEGGDAYKGPYKGDKAGLPSIETPDDKTIIFHLTKRFSDFDYLMALPAAAPVPAAKDTGTKYQFKPVSSGPYKVQTYQPGKLVVLTRNTNWDAKTDPNRKALPDQIRVTEGLEPDVIDQQLIAGTTDIYIEGTGMQPTAVAKVLRDPNLKKNADNPSTGFLRYISVQKKVKPLDNVACRRAVFYAADKTSLQFARGGPVAGGDIATNLTVPTLPSYQKSDMYPSGADNKGDVTKAKEELQKCGQPNGFATKIAATNQGKGPKVATALQQALARVGIKASLALVDSATYYSGFIGVPDNVHKRGLGLAVAGWGPDFPTEYGYYASIVDPRAIKSQGNSNYAEEDNPKVAELIDQALAEEDNEKKLQIWRDLERTVMEDAVILPFVHDKALFYRNPRVSNVYVNQAFGQYDYVNMGLK